MSHDLARPRGEGILKLYERKLFIVCNYPPKFGVCGYYDVGDVAHLLCPVTCIKTWSKGFLILWKEALRCTYHCARICCHLHCGTSDIIFQIYHMTSLDQVLKVLSNFVRPRDLSVSWLYWNKLIIACLHSAKFGSHRHCGSKYIKLLVFKWSSNITWLFGQETCRK